MPGIGPWTGSTILAEIGDGTRFDHGAVICLARRRCNVILAMLRTNQAYNPGHADTSVAARAA